MPVSQKRLGEIAAIADEDIDTTDIPEADEAWFEGAKLVRPPGGEGTGGDPSTTWRGGARQPRPGS